MKTTNKAKTKCYGFTARLEEELKTPVLKAVATETLKTEDKLSVGQMISELVWIGLQSKYPELVKR